VFSAKPNSLPLTIKLIDECESEDLASIFTRFGKQWQLAAAASAPSLEVSTYLHISPALLLLTPSSTCTFAPSTLVCAWAHRCEERSYIKNNNEIIWISSQVKSKQWYILIVFATNNICSHLWFGTLAKLQKSGSHSTLSPVFYLFIRQYQTVSDSIIQFVPKHLVAEQAKAEKAK
jgi:hypothetical protein